MEYDKEAILAETDELIIYLKSILPQSVDPLALGAHSKIHLKAQVFGELSLYRITDLADSAYLLYQKEKIIPALLITRAVLETLAIFAYLHKSIEDIIKVSEITIEFIANLDKLILGRRFEISENDPLRAINIMTFIKKLEKDFNGLFKDYEFLCDFCHPSNFGMFNGYSKFNNEQILTELSLVHLVGKHPHQFGLNMLKCYLELFIGLYNESAEMLMKLAKLTEEYYKNN